MRYNVYMSASEMLPVNTDKPLDFNELSAARWMTCEDTLGHKIHINIARIAVIKEVKE